MLYANGSSINNRAITTCGKRNYWWATFVNFKQRAKRQALRWANLLVFG